MFPMAGYHVQFENMAVTMVFIIPRQSRVWLHSLIIVVLYIFSMRQLLDMQTIVIFILEI